MGQAAAAAEEEHQHGLANRARLAEHRGRPAVAQRAAQAHGSPTVLAAPAQFRDGRLGDAAILPEGPKRQVGGAAPDAGGKAGARNGQAKKTGRLRGRVPRVGPRRHSRGWRLGKCGRLVLESAADGDSRRAACRGCRSRFLERRPTTTARSRSSCSTSARPARVRDRRVQLLAKVLAFQRRARRCARSSGSTRPTRFGTRSSTTSASGPKEVVIDKQLAETLEDPMHCVRWRSPAPHPARGTPPRRQTVTLWRTGSAGCVVDTIVLVYGGTLNGNIGRTRRPPRPFL